MVQLAHGTLHRLFYRSRQSPETAMDLDFAVRRIIATSIERNRVVGLTGMLLVVKDHFVQALEGDVNEVRTTYARISMDRRHQDLRIISQGPAQSRLFADWHMCASALSASDKVILDVLGRRADFNPQALNADSAERLLTAVAAIQRRSVPVRST